MKVIDICTCEYPVDLGDGRCRFCGGLIPRALEENNGQGNHQEAEG